MQKRPFFSHETNCMVRFSLRSHTGWRERNIFFYKGVETSHYQTHFKSFEGKPVRESPKRIISDSSGFGRLQIVSEPDTRQCASKEAEP